MPNRSIMTLRPGSQKILKKGWALQKGKNKDSQADVWAPPVFLCACAPRAYWRVFEIHATFSSPISRPSPTSGISIPTPVPPNLPHVLPVLKRTIMSPVNADLRAGDPEVRPAFGRCVLSLKSGVAALDD